MSRPEITIGLSVSLSGKFHLQGRQTLQGARLWQSYINAQGGIVVQNGEKRSVRLIWYDDRSQISGARKNVFRLLREDQIDGGAFHVAYYHATQQAFLEAHELAFSYFG